MHGSFVALRPDRHRLLVTAGSHELWATLESVDIGLDAYDPWGPAWTTDIDHCFRTEDLWGWHEFVAVLIPAPTPVPFVRGGRKLMPDGVDGDTVLSSMRAAGWHPMDLEDGLVNEDLIARFGVEAMRFADGGYGPARVFSPDQVSALAAAVVGLTAEAVTTGAKRAGQGRAGPTPSASELVRYAELMSERASAFFAFISGCHARGDEVIYGAV